MIYKNNLPTYYLVKVYHGLNSIMPNVVLKSLMKSTSNFNIQLFNKRYFM